MHVAGCTVSGMAFSPLNLHAGPERAAPGQPGAARRRGLQDAAAGGRGGPGAGRCHVSLPPPCKCSGTCCCRPMCCTETFATFHNITTAHSRGMCRPLRRHRRSSRHRRSGQTRRLRPSGASRRRSWRSSAHRSWRRECRWAARAGRAVQAQVCIGPLHNGGSWGSATSACSFW